MIAKILHIITKLNYHLLQKKTKEVLVFSTASPLRPRVCQKLTVHVKGDLANQ